MKKKKKIIIEQTIELYDKKIPDIKKIAKEKGIKFTNKRETTKSIFMP